MGIVQSSTFELTANSPVTHLMQSEGGNQKVESGGSRHRECLKLFTALHVSVNDGSAVNIDLGYTSILVRKGVHRQGIHE